MRKTEAVDAAHRPAAEIAGAAAEAPAAAGVVVAVQATVALRETLPVTKKDLEQKRVRPHLYLLQAQVPGP